MHTATSNPQRRTAGMLIEDGNGSKTVEHRGHPFRTGLRQRGIGCIDGGHRGEVPTAHARVKELEVRRDHCGSAWLRWSGVRLGIRQCGVRLGICRSSTGSKPTKKEHYKESEESKQIRFSYEEIHRILSPFCDWPGTYLVNP